MIERADCLLCLITDRRSMHAETLEEAVEAACRGGVTMVQVREKGMHSEELASEAASLKRITDTYGIPLIIDDDIEVAARVGAAGVHLGQADRSVSDARSMLGDSAAIGISAHTLEQACAAEAAGADYLGVGACYRTSTKPDATTIPSAEFDRILSDVTVSCIAVGGIDCGRIPDFRACSPAGFAVSSAIMGADDIESAVRALRREIDRLARIR
ncbi:MAG: thiamine phosphate synthase [Coriobacteriaceae bacterium]|nr:thiamine phosphate synthase [Coriobacteriaceae bacterium]